MVHQEATVISAHLSSSFSSDIVTMEGPVRLWCYRRKAESGKMICCDNSNCPTKWFHTTEVPEDEMDSQKKVAMFIPSSHGEKS